MAFHSIPFLALLTLTYLAYWRLANRGRNALLALAGFVFYAWWDWRYLGLVFFSIAVDYAAGIGIEAAASQRRRRAWLLVSLVTQLGMLGFFKYFDFGVQSMAAALRSIGVDAHPEPLRLILPVGISFYTFQSLSYTIDVYRGRLRATRDPVQFSAFIMFFPQLVAGPIERAENLLGQFASPRRFDASLAADGLRQMLWGYVMKTVVADNCARIADAAYATPGDRTGLELLVGTWAFAWQIYGDFSGYSNIAVGCARLFGIDLMRNFAAPYFSRGMAEFWRRWHVSLSTWFRDYVYVQIGGNRCGPLRARLNVLFTFALSGLWHGAGFNYVLWGLFHGGCVAAGWRGPGSGEGPPSPGGLLPRLGDAARMFLVFHAACLGWVFFRARDASEAWMILGRIGSGLGSAAADAAGAARLGGASVAPVAAVVAVAAAAEWVSRAHPHPFAALRAPRAVRWCVYAALVVLIAAAGRREDVPFIYFQF
ncbi:MAG: Peptidoglycan O-acetyltransferase [Planctomycetes bacterium]|nr:Peptidoglycan O-acetyltransferase [Planctomycetota bacterium]